MTEITAYHNPNAPIYRQWIAYIVLDDGKLWGVYAVGATEEAAKTKIQTLWESERQRVNRKLTEYKPEAFSAQPSSASPQPEKLTSVDPWAGVKSTPFEAPKHHLAGKVWLIHKHTREKVRVDPEVAEASLASGNWIRGGPRSK